MAVTNCLYPPLAQTSPRRHFNDYVPSRVASLGVIVRFSCSRVRAADFSLADEKSNSLLRVRNESTGDGNGDENLFGGTTMVDRTMKYTGDTDPAVILPLSHDGKIRLTHL